MKNRLMNLLFANRARGSFKAVAEVAGNTIELYDVIVSSDSDAEWFGGVSLSAFSRALDGMTGDVELRINCPGGDVFAGIAMAQRVRDYQAAGKGNVIAHIDGYAASAASLLPLAAKKTIMAPQSMIMIHCAWTIAMGNSDEFLSTAALLAKIDGQLAEGYAAKGNKTAAEFHGMMAQETWFTPQEALDVGLCTEIAPDTAKPDAAKAAATWDLSAFDHAPQPKPAPPAPAQTESEKAAALAAAAAVAAAAEAAADESERLQRLRALQALLVTAA